MNSIRDWAGATNISKILPPHEFPQFASQYTRMQTARTRFSQGVQQLQDRVLERSSIIGGATPQRTVDGKFLDSDNGGCSAVVAEYDEQKEREIAEAIFDWWISKKPFKQWFAEKYQQGTLDFGEDNEQ